MNYPEVVAIICLCVATVILVRTDLSRADLSRERTCPTLENLLSLDQRVK